jgi:hypothetical protein
MPNRISVSKKVTEAISREIQKQGKRKIHRML